jgi:FkbM family methyltransferase
MLCSGLKFLLFTNRKTKSYDDQNKEETTFCYEMPLNICAMLRPLIIILCGLAAGLAFSWVIRMGGRASLSSIRFPRAYTEIFRSTRLAASAPGPAARGPAAPAAQPRASVKKSLRPAAKAVEEEEEAEEEVKKPKKRAPRGKKKSKVVEPEEEAAEEEAPEEKPEEAAEEEGDEKVAEEEAPPPPPSPSKAPAAKKAKKQHRGKAPKNEAPAVEELPRKVITPKGASAPLPKLFKTEEDIPEFCEGGERFPEEEVEWHVVENDEADEDAHPCHLANVTHWALKYYHKLADVKICTHDPTVDTVISDHLHKWSFWGSPDEWMVLLAAGPCTEERPYMLDIGSNLGVFSLIGAERGCHAVAFEPLSENIHRLSHSVKKNGYESNVMLMQHAVGKYFTDVTIGFRPSNPGASGINLGGSKTETVQQITIDGLLLGKNPPVFKDAKEKGLPPLLGQYINFVKVDTEGYDVAVVQGMMRTFVEGRVPLVRHLLSATSSRRLPASHFPPFRSLTPPFLSKPRCLLNSALVMHLARLGVTRPLLLSTCMRMVTHFGSGAIAFLSRCSLRITFRRQSTVSCFFIVTACQLFRRCSPRRCSPCPPHPSLLSPTNPRTRMRIFPGTGRRVFEAWFIRDDYVETISKIEASTGRRKLVSDIG